MKIAIVVPTISRGEPKGLGFYLSWARLFRNHDVVLFTVFDSIKPIIIRTYRDEDFEIKPDVRFSGLVNHHNDGVRNYGFVEAVKSGAEIIITLDDDVFPDNNDPIQEHLDALAGSYPTSWFNPFDGAYMRGFPYGVRTESRAVVSHGIWTGVQDFDAPTTLVRGTAPAKNMYRGAIPKGCLTPISGMNLAFRREVAHLVYFAPMAADTGFNRFSDIWMGIHLKRALDEKNLALVHGLSTVRHERQSNVFKNLASEAAGIRANETHWQSGWADEYEKSYFKKRDQWEKLMKEIM